MADNAIGMSVPGATSALMNGVSLGDQVAGETMAARRKRLQALQASKQLPSGISSLAAGYGSSLNLGGA